MPIAIWSIREEKLCHAKKSPEASQRTKGGNKERRKHQACALQGGIEYHGAARTRFSACVNKKKEYRGRKKCFGTMGENHRKDEGLTFN